MNCATIRILTKFESLGLSASFHFADDSGKEWSIAHKEQSEAIALYKQHPELQERMMELSKQFLWSLKSELKT